MTAALPPVTEPPAAEPSVAEPWADHVLTHSAAVFLAGDLAIKVKRPVRLPFLDFTDTAERERACYREVALNRRLAPDVYLGVGHLGTADRLGEPTVVMRRLPTQRRLDQLVQSEPDRLADAPRLLGRTLAQFHGQGEPFRGGASPGTNSRIHEAWAREGSEIEALGDAVTPRHERIAVRRLAQRYLAGRSALFDHRVEQGWIRDGHGDLRCEHVYLLDDGPRIIDCLDFDPELRVCDVLADLAFLVMDLEAHGAADLAARLVDRYDEYSGEHHPRSLLEFYVAQRALVRAKVSALPGGECSRAPIFHALARTHLERALPIVMILGGLPGSGKTAIAAELASRRDAAHLSTDEVRHELFPGARHQPYGQYEYSPLGKDVVYEEVFRRARIAVALGESVVLDASFAAERHRLRALDLATTTAGVPVEVHCVVSESVAEQRLSRPREGGSFADAGTRTAMRRDFASWPTATLVRTETSLPESVSEAERALLTAVSAVGEGLPDS